FFQAEDGIRDFHVTGVQTCALPICQLGPEVGCTVEDFRRADQPDPQRVVLGRSVVHEATAQVAVELVYGGPLGGDAWSERISFPLVRSGDAWLIDTVAWPYLGCDGRP